MKPKQIVYGLGTIASGVSSALLGLELNLGVDVIASLSGTAGALVGLGALGASAVAAYVGTKEFFWDY
jgi:hypothetical protein